jgi:hypothetical protein
MFDLRLSGSGPTCRRPAKLLGLLVRAVGRPARSFPPRGFASDRGTTGRSHHLRQHEIRDGHAFKPVDGGVRPNARENGQISPLPPFRVPGVRAVIRAASLSCRNAGKAQNSGRFGGHLENPG